MEKQFYKILTIIISLCVWVGCMPEYYKLNESGYQKIQHKDYDGAFKDFDSSIKLDDT